MQKFSLLLDKYSKYLIAAFLIIVPLYPKFPFIRIPGSYVSVRFEDFLILIMAVYVAVKALGNIRSFLENRFTRSIGVYIFAGLVSVISAVFLTQTAGFSTAMLHLVRRIEYFVPFFAAYYYFKDAKNPVKTVEFFIKCIMIVVFVDFVYGLGQRYLSWPVIITQNEEYSKGVALRWIPGSHINATFAGHYDLATYLVLVMPLILASFFAVKDKIQKIAIGLTSLGGLWLLINAVSRISVASYFVALFVTFMLLKKYKQLVLVVVFSLIAFTTSQSLLGRYVNLKNIFSLKISSEIYAQEPEALGVRYNQTPTPTSIPVIEDRSTSIRLNVEWPRAVRAFSKNPLLGTGYSSITLATDNDYLRLLGEVGILGFISFVVILANIVMDFAKNYIKNYSLTLKRNKFANIFLSSIAGGFCGMLVNAAFIDVFEASKIAVFFWFLMGCTVILPKVLKNE